MIDSASPNIDPENKMNIQILAKILNFNLSIELDHKNYINWKAQVIATIRALELEDFISSIFMPPSSIMIDSSPIEPKANPTFKS